jgi:hypothetical protein
LLVVPLLIAVWLRRRKGLLSVVEDIVARAVASLSLVVELSLSLSSFSDHICVTEMVKLV